MHTKSTKIFTYYRQIKPILTLIFCCFATTNQLQAIPKDIDYSPLSRISGLPLAGSAQNAVQLHDENKQGDAVGIACFTAITGQIDALWYWESTTGFQIISSSTTVPRTQKDYFQFYKACINDLGVIACSYLDGISNHQTHNFLYGWVWWSKKEGLHISLPTKEYKLVVDINNKDYVLLSKINTSALIIDIHNEKNCKEFGYRQDKIRDGIKPWIEEKNKELRWDIRPQDKTGYHCNCITINAKKLSDDFKIQGNSVVDVTLTRESYGIAHYHHIPSNLTVNFEFYAEGPWTGLWQVYLEADK